MLAFLVQTLFALQRASKRNGSCSSHPSGAHLPSHAFVLTKRNNKTPCLQQQVCNPEKNGGEMLDWLQERLVLNKNEQLIERCWRSDFLKSTI
jgi:hypothetical protein